jgi:Asp-tRNA(Asn)/Glu-tRNA(Gln) amidotransferase A subunit family amidase
MDPDRADDRIAPADLDRRRFLTLASALGLAAGAAPSLLAQEEKKGTITREALADAESLTGLQFTETERTMMLNGLEDLKKAYATLREVEIDNSVPPAFHFAPTLPGGTPPIAVPRAPFAWTPSIDRVKLPAAPPANLEDLAFLPVSQIASLLASGKVKSVDLTKMYLARLRRFDPLLHAVINYTEERALEAAERADREIAAGKIRSPLHGVPWGAKDLLAARGAPTTWGSVLYKDQVLDYDATVVERLEAAGAVLVAKLGVGELAWGDVWFRAMTRNPWKPEQGSSGSSAGSAAAVTAGLVGFTLGTETLGSIVSPSTRCGATGLRPTFGRVSRHGAMALAWTMDKIGTLCRSVEDCAAVFNAIHGPDGQDETVIDAPFRWNPRPDLRRLRVGYLKSAFDEKPPEGLEEWRANDLAALEAVRHLGIELVPISLPTLPFQALRIILTAESAATFDQVTRDGKDDLMIRQVEQAWPNVFRQGQTIPAVAYIQANRVRTLLKREMAKLMSTVDVYIAPSFSDNLLLTNLTGNPAVVLPDGFRKDGTPTSLTFTGKLFGEADLLALAKAYQDATGFHLKHPDLKEGTTPPYPPPATS